MKTSARRRLTLLLLACCLVLASLIVLIFQQQQQKLEQQFDTLVHNNLTELTHNQVILTSGMVNDGQTTLHAIATAITQQNDPPPTPWLETLLEALDRRSNAYLIDYLATGELEETLTALETLPNQHQLQQQLENGEALITDVYYSPALDRHFFAILPPVWQNGELLGFLRMRIAADLLITDYQQNQLSSQLFRCVITEDGRIIYSNSDHYPSNGNLYASLPLSHVDESTIAQIQDMVSGSDQITSQIEVKNRHYYVSVDHLPYNNWHVVNFLRSADINLDSSAIVRSVMTSGLLLVALTALGCLGIVWLLLRQKKRLNLEEKRYTMLEQFSDTLLFEYHYDTDTLSFTPNAQQRLQLAELTITALSDPQKTFNLLYPDDYPILTEMLQAIPTPEEADQTLTRELRLCCLDGNYRWFDCQYKYLLEPTGKANLIIGKLSDITDQRSREMFLQEQARRDALTGIYNKIGEKLIDQRLSACGSGLFFMMDLDNFKMINDTFSHAAGDRLLTQVGALLRSTFRSDDLLARIGGDEFVMFIPESTSIDLAQQKAQALLKAIQSLEIAPSSDEQLTASIGIAVSPQDGVTYDQLYQAADQAMYRVKLHDHKSGYAFYTAPDA